MGRPRPLNRRERAETRAAYTAAPRGVWLITKTGLRESYPCRCFEGDHCDGRPDEGGQPWCPCHGRRTRASYRCCGGPRGPAMVSP